MQINIENLSRDKRNEYKKPSIWLLILTAAYIAAASAYIPYIIFGDITVSHPYETSMFAIMAPAAGIGICMLLSASPKSVVPFCIISGAIMFVGLDVYLSSAICVFIALICVYAFIIREGFWWIAAIPGAMSFAMLYLLTGEFTLPVLSLAYVPVAITLFFAFRKKKQRVPSVASISACMGLVLVALLVVSVYKAYGALSEAAFREFFSSLRADLISKTLEALELALDELDSIVSKADVAELVKTTVDISFNLLPAIVAIFLFVISFIAHSLYVSLLSTRIEDKSEIINAVTFNMSTVSAFVFLLAYILSLVLSNEGLDLYSVAAQNVYTMLLPGFTMITFGFVGSIVRSKRASCLGTLLYMGMFAMLFFMTGITLLLASFAGSIIVILSAIKSKKDKK